MRSRGEGDIERRRGRCDRPTSGAIDDCVRATRRSTSGARPTSALVDRDHRLRSSIALLDRRSHRTISSIAIVDRAARRRGAIVGWVARSGLSLLSLSLSDLGSLFSLFLSFSGNDLKWKWGWKIISGSKVKILVNRKSFSVTAKHAGLGENDFLKSFSPKTNAP